MSEFPPLIYVDVVQDQPLSYDDFWRKHDRNLNGDSVYEKYLERFQPWRVLIKSGDNQEPLFRSTESYFNEADARHAVDLAFGPGSNIYLRASEKGNELLRAAVRP